MIIQLPEQIVLTPVKIMMWTYFYSTFGSYIEGTGEMSHTRTVSNSIMAKSNQKVVFTSPLPLYSTFLKKVMLKSYK